MKREAGGKRQAHQRRARFELEDGDERRSLETFFGSKEEGSCLEYSLPEVRARQASLVPSGSVGWGLQAHKCDLYTGCLMSVRLT